MSKSVSNTKKVINLPVRNDYYSLVSKKRLNKHSECVVMSFITEKEEKLIDEGHSIRIKRGNISFIIKPEDIYCYGIIDLHHGSEDMDVISTFNWLDHLNMLGVCVPANYNYNTHTCVSDIKKVQWYDTTKCDVLAQYAHGFIGKPERTIIFRQIC